MCYIGFWGIGMVIVVDNIINMVGSVLGFWVYVFLFLKLVFEVNLISFIEFIRIYLFFYFCKLVKGNVLEERV